MAVPTRVSAGSVEQAQSTRAMYASRGFVTVYEVNQPERAHITMRKNKQLNVALLLLGLLFFIWPGLIYLLVHALRSDEVVEIVFEGSARPEADDSGGRPPVVDEPGPQLSPDGREWWDGETWRSTATSAPTEARRSADGSEWWDGTSWRPVPIKSLDPDASEAS
jgi:hypothetical protein